MDENPQDMEGVQQQQQNEEQQAKPERVSPFTFQPALVIGDMVNVVRMFTGGRRRASAFAPPPVRNARRCCAAEHIPEDATNLHAGTGNLRRCLRPV